MKRKACSRILSFMVRLPKYYPWIYFKFFLGWSEFVSEESANSPIFREIIEKIFKASLQISEFRKWELYKSYPGIAQGNVHLKG